MARPALISLDVAPPRGIFRGSIIMYTPRREPIRWSLFALALCLALSGPARGQQPGGWQPDALWREARPHGDAGDLAGRVAVRSGDPAPVTARFGSAYDSVAVAPDGLAFIDRARTALFLKGIEGVRTLAHAGEEMAGGERLAGPSRVAAGAARSVQNTSAPIGSPVRSTISGAAARAKRTTAVAPSKNWIPATTAPCPSTAGS